MKEELLRLFKQQPETYLSGETLSHTLGVTRAFVWKLIRALEEDGYRFEAKPRKGYRLTESPDIPSALELRPLLRHPERAENIRYFSALLSTNHTAREWAEYGAPGGTVILAGSQTAGKARGRGKWESAPGKGVYLSAVLRPELSPAKLPEYFSDLCAAVCRALQTMTRGICSVGEDGGVFAQGQKICGILHEYSGDSDYTDYVILGAGINTYRPECASVWDTQAHPRLNTETAAAVINQLEDFFPAEIIPFAQPPRK